MNAYTKQLLMLYRNGFQMIDFWLSFFTDDHLEGHKNWNTRDHWDHWSGQDD